MKSITATNLVNVFNGTINFATLLGAFLCDTYFGRYKTLGFASVSSFLVFHLHMYCLFLCIPKLKFCASFIHAYCAVMHSSKLVI